MRRPRIAVRSRPSEHGLGGRGSRPRRREHRDGGFAQLRRMYWIQWHNDRQWVDSRPRYQNLLLDDSSSRQWARHLEEILLDRALSLSRHLRAVLTVRPVAPPGERV